MSRRNLIAQNSLQMGGEIILIKFTVKPNPNAPPAPGTPALPTIEYIAEEGMTFEDFVNSEYNVDGWTLHNLDNDRLGVKHQFNGYITNLNAGNSIRANTVINNDDVYGWY